MILRQHVTSNGEIKLQEIVKIKIMEHFQR